MITLQRRKKNHISGSCSVSQNSVCQSYVWVSRVGRGGDTVWPVNQHIKVTNWGVGGWRVGFVVCGGTQGKLFVSRVFVFGGESSTLWYAKDVTACVSRVCGGRGSVASCGKQGKQIYVSRMGKTGTRCVTYGNHYIKVPSQKNW